MSIATIGRARWLAVFAGAALIAACGGGGSGSADGGGAAAPAPAAAASAADSVTVLSAPTEVTAARIAAAKAAVHTAALGTLAGAKVEVRDAFDRTETVIATATTDDNGRFSVALPDYATYAMFRVTVSGGNDWDVRDTGTRDATPTPFKGEINALVDPSDLLNGSIRVTFLSDAAYRLIGGDLSRFTAGSLNTELNRMAGVLLKSGLYTTGSATSNDLLQFDATSAAHRAALNIDASTLWQPLDASSTESLIDKYHAGSTAIAAAWRSLTAAVPGVATTLAQQINKSSAKLQVGVSGIGRVTGNVLPGNQLDRTPQPWSTVLPRDGSTVTLTAAATDAGWTFHSWVGCTRVSGMRCDVSMTDDAAVSAHFTLVTPVLKAGVTSLGRLTPREGVTGIRITGDAGTAPFTATIVTRDAATAAFLKTVQVGSFIQTGSLQHPTVKVTGVLQGASEVAPGVPGSTVAAMTTVSLQVEEASPLDVYDAVSVVVDNAPMAFDEVRAITLADDVTGSVRTVMPTPDFTSSVVEASVLGTPPSWYVTLAADGKSCRAYGIDALVRGALQTAWQADPRGYPFNAAALVNCIALGQVQLAGDLTDYVTGKSSGETDLMSGRHDGTGKLAMVLPKGAPYQATRLAKGERLDRRGEPVWVAGVGVAVPLGNNLFLASRESGQGFRLVAVQDIVSITPAQAVKQAAADCGRLGLSSACGMLAQLERERMGLRNVGMIPLLSAPLSFTLQKPGSNLSGTVTLNLNIDISPNAKFDWSLPGLWISADAGATYTIKPELGLTVAYGKSVESFTVPTLSKKKKFNPKNSAAKAKANEIELSKNLIKIDLGRAIPVAGAVLDLSLNLEVGVDIGGEVSVTVTPTLTLAGDVGMHAYYEYHTFRADDKILSTWFNMPTKQPGVSAEMKGTLQVEPFAQLYLGAGLRAVAPDFFKLYVKGGVVFRGEVATGFSYATRFRTETTPVTYAEGAVLASSAKYYESCSLETRRTNPSSCSCKADQVTVVKVSGKDTNVVTAKCVQRGAVVTVPGKTSQIPQRCVNGPELALGAYVHARAGAATSSEKFIWPLNSWLGFIDKDFAFFDQEWPIWEYPAKDDQPEEDLTGCKDIR